MPHLVSMGPDGALSIHLDQLAEIEADRERGVVSETEAAAADDGDADEAADESDAGADE